MKLHAALCFLVFAGCATAPVLHATQLPEGGGGTAGGPTDMAAPVRMQTPAGTFMVSPQHAEDFAKALAGESTPTRFYAGAEP